MGGKGGKEGEGKENSFHKDGGLNDECRAGAGVLRGLAGWVLQAGHFFLSIRSKDTRQAGY